MKGLSLVGQEEMPHGVGLRTGGWGDTADGAGDCRRPAQLSTIAGRNRKPNGATDLFFVS